MLKMLRVIKFYLKGLQVLNGNLKYLVSKSKFSESKGIGYVMILAWASSEESEADAQGKADRIQWAFHKWAIDNGYFGSPEDKEA